MLWNVDNVIQYTVKLQRWKVIPRDSNQLGNIAYYIAKHNAWELKKKSPHANPTPSPSMMKDMHYKANCPVLII